ncbi:restriction endonuclease [Euryarchaeota archaeon]|nr:restriction endonuclease [Euryarchaeota archaeon]
MVEIGGRKIRLPKESEGYQKKSSFAVAAASKIISKVIESGRNDIHIWINLNDGIPMENINKIAGPVVEEWACEKYKGIYSQKNNQYQLCFINDELERLHMADVILGFRPSVDKPKGDIIAEVDVKATSKDIKNSGKSPNITSFARIRNAYLNNPNYMFLICSIKHKVTKLDEKYTDSNVGVMSKSKMTVVDCKVYDLKNLSDKDISYNPALGTGQLQVRNIHSVTEQKRTAEEFICLLDKKYLASKKGLNGWQDLANKEGWYESK